LSLPQGIFCFVAASDFCCQFRRALSDLDFKLASITLDDFSSTFELDRNLRQGRANDARFEKGATGAVTS
jgi:hypothetical protein